MEFDRRPAIDGSGQVYADVLVAKLLVYIFDKLGIVPRSSRQQHFRLADGGIVSLSYADVLLWLGLSDAKAARMRTTANQVEKAHRLLSDVQQRLPTQLDTSETKLLAELSVLMNVDLNQAPLPRPAEALGTALTNAQRGVVVLKRTPFLKQLKKVQSKYVW